MSRMGAGLVFFGCFLPILWWANQSGLWYAWVSVYSLLICGMLIDALFFKRKR